ncbi:hypothetical protein [Euzebya sp.]|uniref:hypothetical protein n=1 Tax=Euzebya sp. TaxID=1971409 RepID=UPI003515BA70
MPGWRRRRHRARWWRRTEHLRFGLALAGVAVLFLVLAQYEPRRTDTAEPVVLAPATVRAQGDAVPTPAVDPVPEPAWVWWGDGLTAGQGGGGVHAPAVLGELLGVDVVNFGVGGEGSAEIAARANAIPTVLDVAGGQIPPAGEVAVSPNVELLLQGPSVLLGRLAGVDGRLISGPNGSYTFQRDEPGEPVVTDAAQFVSTTAEAYRDHQPILWLGRNNHDDPERIVADTQAIIEHHGAAEDRFAVLTVLNFGVSEGSGTPTYDAIAAVNTALADRWPDHLIDVRRCLIDTGMDRAGIAPSVVDVEAMAADAVPPSLTSDPVHLTAEGYTAVAGCVHDWMVERGWTSDAMDLDGS